eukprot:jgi/Chrzof1/2546/Cz11g19190.t1
MTCCTITLREFAEETLGLFSSCSVNAQAVTLSAISMAEQIRNKQQTLRVVHQLKKGEYHMFIAQTPFIDPMMFQLAIDQNNQTGAVSNAEKLEVAWVPLCELMTTVSRCSCQYFYAASRVGCHHMGALGKRRMQLHPCFANSLRIAQASGLHELVNTLSVAPLPLVPRQALQSINTHEEAVSHDIQRPAQELRPEHMLYWVTQDWVAQQLKQDDTPQHQPEQQQHQRALGCASPADAAEQHGTSS